MNDNQGRPKIIIRGFHAEGNAGHGIYVNNADLDAEDVTTIHNGGDGLHVAKTPSLVESLGLPADVDPKALAKILTVLVDTAPAEREQVAKESSFLKGLSVLADSTSLATTIIAIAGSPNVHRLIEDLLK